MAVAEREVQGSQSDFSFLKEVKELNKALAAGVEEEFKVRDFGKLEKAAPDVQQRIVLASFVKAKKIYDGEQNTYKLREIRDALVAYQGGTLTVHKLLQGLELIPKPESESSRNGGFFGRIGKAVRKIKS